MKNVFKTIILAYFVIIQPLSSCRTGLIMDGTYTVEIYSTNDVHGRVFDSLYTEKERNPYSLSSLSTIIRQAREIRGDKGVILLDAGDFLQGDNSVYYYNYVDTLSEHIFSKVVNYLKYDAVAVGNHDIEAGHGVYDRVREQISAPYLAANAVSVSTGSPYFTPCHIINKNGIKTAVIGLTNPNIKKWISEHLYSGMDFSEAVPLVDSLVKDVVERENPHLVIGLFHLGLGDQTTYDPENCAKYVASTTEGFDVIFAAHDHKKFAGFITSGKDSVALMEAGSRASGVSRATVTIEFKDGKVVSKKVIPEIIELQEIIPDSEYNGFFRSDYLTVRNFTKKDIGVLKCDLNSAGVLDGPTEYVDMIHKLQLESSGADISFAAPLNLNLKLSQGVINFQDLMSIYPFENNLYVLEMSGYEIKDYLEYSYKQWINKAGMKYNYDSAAGIFYEVKLSGGEGNKIRIISLADRSPFVPNKTYKVAMTSYRANGGGDLLVKGAKIPEDQLKVRVQEMGEDIRGLLHKKILERGELTPEKLNHWKFVK